MHLVLPNNQSVFDPTVFDYSYYESHIDAIYSLLPNETWDDKTTLDIFNGIVAKLKTNCKQNLPAQSKLIKYLDANDTRRHTDWKSSFPYLNNQLKDNYVV